jgi:MtN3 and saliva related transmembrane protein
MNWVTVLGLSAGAVSTVAMMPQIIKIWRTRHTKDLSLLTFTLIFIGGVLWSAYGLILHDWPIILPNVLITAIVFSILILKIKYG